MKTEALGHSPTSHSCPTPGAKPLRRSACVIGLGFIALIHSAHAELITNGSFEMPDVAKFERINAGETTIAPWHVGIGSVDVVDIDNGFTRGPAYVGRQYLDLDGTSRGQLTQSFATTPGMRYAVSFFYANNYTSQASASATVRVYDDAGERLDETITHNTSRAKNLRWKFFQEHFVAKQNVTHLEFTSLSAAGSNGGILLDAVAVAVAPAPTLTVTNTNDSGGGSLRDAVIAANGNPQDDTIEIQVAGVIVLTSTLLQVENSGSLTITGPGKDLLTISGNNNSRVFYFRPSVRASISGMTITGGNSLGSEYPGYGGGVYNRGTLTVKDVRITENSALISGGGLYNSTSDTVTLNSCIITNNRCDSDNNGIGDGGGLYNKTGGKMTINNSTISGNMTGDHPNSRGGGIMTYSSTLTIAKSAITNHSISSDGGGIYIYRSTVNITNSTIGKNSAANGGGIFNTATQANIKIYNSTVARNHATSNAGGIQAGAGFNSANSIIAENTAAGDVKDCFGTLNSLGYNLIKNTNGTSVVGPGTGDIIGAAPLLGPLAKNGATTSTFALQEGSPAIDAANPTTFPPTDQRGVARPQDGDGNGPERADIGAFEIRAAESTL